jgi:hypothetical protein
MSSKALSSLDLRAFLRTCYNLLLDEVSLESWTAWQKFLLISSQADFALFVRQLKKIAPGSLLAMHDGFSAGQVESKLWLIEALRAVLPEQAYHFHILGSWFGLLPRMLKWLQPQLMSRVTCYDLESRWNQVAEFINLPDSGQSMGFVTADMCTLPYPLLHQSERAVFVNTSAEHLADFVGWYALLPKGSVVALQANDFADHQEHLSSWKSLSDFQASAPMSCVLFSGTLPMQKYQRFMLIGVK